MTIKRANTEATRYACMHYHYSKTCPVVTAGYNVYNDNGEWCGVIIFGPGANPRIGSPYNLNSKQVVELVRVALNGKQSFTSQALSMAIRTFKKEFPDVKLIVSYSDTQQKHLGIIYQATNWVYVGVSNASSFIVDNKKVHPRSVGRIKGLNKRQTLIRNGHRVDRIKDKPKHKYLFPLHKSIRKEINILSKPYPKSL